MSIQKSELDSNVIDCDLCGEEISRGPGSVDPQELLFESGKRAVRITRRWASGAPVEKFVCSACADEIWRKIDILMHGPTDLRTEERLEASMTPEEHAYHERRERDAQQVETELELFGRRPRVFAGRGAVAFNPRAGAWLAAGPLGGTCDEERAFVFASEEEARVFILEHEILSEYEVHVRGESEASGDEEQAD